MQPMDKLRSGQGRAAGELTSRLGSPVSGSPSLTVPRPSSSSSLLTQDHGENEGGPNPDYCQAPAPYQKPPPPPVFFVLAATQPPGLPVHHTSSTSGLLPRVVILHQAGDQLVR